MTIQNSPRQRGGANVGKVVLIGAVIGAIAALLYALFRNRRSRDR